MAPRNHERIRVVHLIERMAVGGMERTVQLLMEHLPRGRFEQSLCCMSEAGPFAEAARQHGVPVTVLNVTHYYNPAHFMKLVSHLRRHRSQIAHAHGEFASIFGRAAALVAGVPVVLFHAQNIPGYVQRWRHIVQNRALTAASHGVIACAEDTKRYLVERERVPARKVTVIHNSVDIASIDAGQSARRQVRRGLGYQAGNVVLGTVSRMTAVKGHPYLLRAAAKLLEVAPQVRLVLVGDGPERPKLENLARDLGIEDRVTFPGTRSDVPDLLSALDVFVQPTAQVEGLPLSVTEAMAARLPVVATAVGGVREAVKDGVNGFVVPPCDAEGLGDALAALVGDRDLRKAMGGESRKLCETEFSAERMVSRVACVYMDLLRQRCPSVGGA